jgi:hypothetical protein
MSDGTGYRTCQSNRASSMSSQLCMKPFAAAPSPSYNSMADQMCVSVVGGGGVLGVFSTCSAFLGVLLGGGKGLGRERNVGERRFLYRGKEMCWWPLTPMCAPLTGCINAAALPLTTKVGIEGEHPINVA